MSDNEQKKIFSKNLNRYLALNNVTQREVAKAIGVIPSTFNTWCQGIALPRMGKVQALADYFRINKTDLIDAPKEKPTRPARKGVTIKVLGRVAAGIPINAIEEVIDEEEIPEEMARKGEYFGLKIKGDSMAPEIKDGDTVIVRKQDDADSGDIVIAIVNGNDGCCKKLKKIENGVMLISINPAYEPMVFTQSDIDTIPVRIIGRVVEHRRKY